MIFFLFFLSCETWEEKIKLWPFLCLFPSCMTVCSSIIFRLTISTRIRRMLNYLDSFLWDSEVCGSVLVTAPAQSISSSLLPRKRLLFKTFSSHSSISEEGTTVSSLQDSLISLLQEMSSGEKKTKPLFPISAFLRNPHSCILWRRIGFMG